MAGLLSRFDIEDLLDRSCDEALAALDGAPPEYIRSPFQAGFIRNFEGPSSTPDNRILFINQHGEVRACFSLNVDGFSTEGDTRGPKKSSSIISMCCLNLDVELMSKPENVYLVGVIPGPKEPSTTELNNFVRFFIDVFVISWHRGHHFSRSASSSTGRLVRSAITIVVNDLPAARRLAQAAGASSCWICTICQLFGKHNASATNYSDWQKRDVSELQKQAYEWKDAKDTKAREEVFEHTGMRWSEMWRLPYWDMTRQLVPEPMHTLYLNLTKHFMRDVL
ncbi:hypothetical protein OE88DRAFT_1639914, partial [Heliocybe sulcata]